VIEPALTTTLVGVAERFRAVLVQPAPPTRLHQDSASRLCLGLVARLAAEQATTRRSTEERRAVSVKRMDLVVWNPRNTPPTRETRLDLEKPSRVASQERIAAQLESLARSRRRRR